MSDRPAHVIWFTGISGAGKTTLAQGVRERLAGCRVLLLDGDEVRDFFEGDLGYSRAERIINVRRIAFAAKLLADCGITVLVANIAPYYEVRDFIRRKIPQYIQIYVRASLETVRRRDVKGHYANFDSGGMDSLVGLDDAYDPPRAPHLTIDTDEQSIPASLDAILAYLTPRLD